MKPELKIKLKIEQCVRSAGHLSGQVKRSNLVKVGHQNEFFDVFGSSSFESNVSKSGLSLSLAVA